ncbi:hypothetical protein BRADI_1g29663v3 [Brachypodium distachyon]|nr:hypothetical protein BRADI_1g29663v3 [Brachypodium distachyon]
MVRLIRDLSVEVRGRSIEPSRSSPTPHGHGPFARFPQSRTVLLRCLHVVARGSAIPISFIHQIRYTTCIMHGLVQLHLIQRTASAKGSTKFHPLRRCIEEVELKCRKKEKR